MMTARGAAGGGLRGAVHAGRALRTITAWGLANHLLRMIPEDTTFSMPRLLRSLLTQAYAAAGDAAAAANPAAALSGVSASEAGRCLLAIVHPFPTQLRPRSPS